MSEIYRHRYKRSGSGVIRIQDQPNRELLLERNAKLRREGGLANLTFAEHALRIPEIDYYQLKDRHPELASMDPEIRTRAWRAFVASSEADPYRTKDRRGKRATAPISASPSTANRDL